MTEQLSGGAALVAALAAHGVDVAFGIPGTHNLEIYRALPEYGIRHVGVRHEQGAGYAADGYARSSGKVGVAIVTSGPAVFNAAAALGQAWSDSIPILVISPGMPLRHPAAGNGLLHESRDQSGTLDLIGAASLRPTSVAEIPTAVAQAFAIMTNGRPRPVHLEVPLDVLDEVAEVTIPTPVRPAASTPHADDIAAAVSLISRSPRRVIIAGGGARSASDAVRRLANRLNAPVVTTTNGKGVLAEDDPLAIGAGIHLPAVRDLLADADVVVAIGTELAPADLWYGPLPVDGKLIRIDIDPVGILINATPEVAIVGDANAAIEALVASDVASAGWTADEIANRQADKRNQAREEGAVWLGVVDALAASLPRETVVATDNAMVCYLGTLANLPSYGPSAYLFPTGFGTLGFALPAAIGAKIAAPDRAVVAVQGDGGVMFTVAEIATAAAEKLALPIVIVDNAGYGEIRREMIERGDPVQAVTFAGPDFAKLGESLGCVGVTIDLATEDPALLADAVRTAFGADRPTVIHVLMPPEGAAS